MSRFINRMLLLVTFFSLAGVTVAAMADHGLQNAAEHANENANLPDLPATAVDHPKPNENANSNATNKAKDDGDGATAQQNGNNDHMNHGACVSATAHETDPPKGEAVREVAQNNDLVGPECIEDTDSNNSRGNETSEAAKAGGREFGQSHKAENGS